ncbi:GDSL-type esterase/lipase family protein [Kaistia granuli]|uniref:GDSL-type esterase/lipase family protein n=1 Tax=Kaistia granuli TaxID=363259 RepID=UPI00036CDBF7|nr:GDSL-type esterase/lipase family protein [Kaistia granuli]
MLNFNEFGSETPHFLRYVLIPSLIGVGFLLVGWLARPQWAAIAGLSGLAALVALFAFEALLTFQSVPVRLAMLGQLSDESRETLARSGKVVRGFTLARLNNIAGTDSLSNAVLSGFPNAKVILCTPGGKSVTYTADRYGFNNPNQIYDSRMELMLLGDSFVEGFCLPPGDDLASRLRDRGLVAASMGIRGNGPLLELATLGRFGQMFRPRHVAMVFFEGNDWDNFENELKQPWLRSALAPNADFGSQAQASKPLQLARTSLEEASQEPITFMDLVTRTEMLRNFFALQLTLTRLGLVYPKIARTIPEFRDTLRQAKAITRSWGGRFTIVYVPRVDRFMSRMSTDQAFDQIRTLVLEAAAAEGIQVIDLYEAFRDEHTPMRMYAPDSHFSRDGASVAADLIVQNLATVDHAFADRFYPTN